MADEKRLQAEAAGKLEDEALDGIAGGGKGGHPGRCPGCGGAAFTVLGGGRIRCNDCGWEGSKSEIGL